MFSESEAMDENIATTKILDSASGGPVGMMVIAVATLGDRGDDWTAYIGIGGSGIKWINHVARHGTKVDKEIGEALFPHLAEQYIWRY